MAGWARHEPPRLQKAHTYKEDAYSFLLIDLCSLPKAGNLQRLAH
jgi:hypothetical protein